MWGVQYPPHRNSDTENSHRSTAENQRPHLSNGKGLFRELSPFVRLDIINYRFWFSPNELFSGTVFCCIGLLPYYNNVQSDFEFCFYLYGLDILVDTVILLWERAVLIGEKNHVTFVSWYVFPSFCQFFYFKYWI